jgi:hypothetical protein
MNCANCGRKIREAYYQQGGRVYGPKCGLDLGLNVPNKTNPITMQRMKQSKSTPKKVIVQDGQADLFTELPN